VEKNKKRIQGGWVALDEEEIESEKLRGLVLRGGCGSRTSLRWNPRRLQMRE